MIKTVFGLKQETTQRFTQEGERMPVARVKLFPCQVARLKTEAKDGYNAIQLKIGKYLKEVRVDQEEVVKHKVGGQLDFKEILQAGDEVKVNGVSKGKGFTGVMKRWGFKGGPRTHGQSDRARAPGSIGLGTTPGRVFKGKKMAGRAGGGQVTVKGLVVMGLDEEKKELLIKGLLPGAKNAFLRVTKTGKAKNFIPLSKKGEREIKILAEEKKPGVKTKPAKEKEKEEEKKEEPVEAKKAPVPKTEEKS